MSTIDKFGRALNDGERSSVIIRQSMNALPLDTDKHYTADNRRIKLVAHPEQPDDAVPRWYVDRVGIRGTTTSFIFDSKRLTDVGTPLEPTDAVTKIWVEGKCTKLKADVDEAISSNTNGSYETLTADINSIREDIKGLRQQISALASKQVPPPQPPPPKPAGPKKH